jgi:hypothetical protein
MPEQINSKIDAEISAEIFCRRKFYREGQPMGDDNERCKEITARQGPVARLVGNEGGVVSEVFNLESSGVEAPARRPRHDEHYHEA